jgi:hypothetical protein
MQLESYSLSLNTMKSLMRLIDLGLLNSSQLESKPNRREASEVRRFIESYLKEKSSK